MLAAIIPLANAEQASYLFGPTMVIGLIGGSGDGRTVEKPDGLPAPTRGPIPFETWQIEELDERQRVLSRTKIINLLRREYPEQTSQMSYQDLYKKVHDYEQSGNAINLTSEKALIEWSCLNIVTEDAAHNNNRLKSLIANLPPSTTNGVFDETCDDILKCYYRAKAQNCGRPS